MHGRNRDLGYTLIELLVVLAIVGILAIAAGTYVFQPRQKPAVQNVLNEVEGLISEAHKHVSTSLGNIQVNGSGSWNAKTLEINFQTLKLVGPPEVPARIVSRFRADAFSDWIYAGVDDSGDASQVATAVGGETLLAALANASPDLQQDLQVALANSLFAGGGQGIVLNATNKQFLTPFCIPVVGLREGKAFAGAPAGYIVVSGNRVYKFYKPGPGAANPWRRL